MFYYQPVNKGYPVSPQQATAEIFLTAFKAMPKSGQNLVLARLLKDKNLREDLIDLAIAQKREKEKTVPLRQFLEKQS
jgi:hypothetical protein